MKREARDPMTQSMTPVAHDAKTMSGADYRSPLRARRPTVYVDGQLIESVADARALQPGINALAVTYDFARDPEKSALMTALQTPSGKTVNRMLHLNESAGDLLNKLEAVRILCQETGCAQRYLAHDALNAIAQVSALIDDARGTKEHGARFAAYLQHVQDEDLALGIAMTDAKGDRSKRPHEQANPDTYVTSSSERQGHRHLGDQGDRHGRPYMHEFLVMPGRRCRSRRRVRGVLRRSRRCARPDDRAPARRPPGEKLEHGAALFSRRTANRPAS
jgi:4-hydroxybutyryl-CoA dehydratase/vinylacetyl-CoA-Delta-isomerase